MLIMGELRADHLVWIFGTGRSGSTWLASMMGDMAGGRLWNEPLVGKLFEYISKIVHSLTPVPLKNTRPGTLHSPVRYRL